MVQNIKVPKGKVFGKQPAGGKGERGLLERLADVERHVPNLAKAVNQGFQELGGKVDGLQNLVECLVQLVGPEVVMAAMAERERKEMEARDQQFADALKEAVAAGVMVASEAVKPEGLVVGQNTKDGQPVGTGRVQIAVARMEPTVRDQLLGKPVGTVVETTAGTRFEVTEIYEKAPPKAATTPADSPAALPPADDITSVSTPER